MEGKVSIAPELYHLIEGLAELVSIEDVLDSFIIGLKKLWKEAGIQISEHENKSFPSNYQIAISEHKFGYLSMDIELGEEVEGLLKHICSMLAIILSRFKQEANIKHLNSEIKSLRDKVNKANALIESAPYAIILLSGIDQETDYINPAFTEITGYTEVELPRLENWWELAYPSEDYREHVKSVWQELVTKSLKTKSTSVPIETTISCKDGTKKELLWIYVFTEYQSWTFAQDITERKKAQRELIESEEKFRNLYENSPFGIAICQVLRNDKAEFVDFIHLQANQATFNNTGFKEDQLVGKKASEMVDTQTLNDLIEKYNKVIDSAKPLHYEQYFEVYHRTLEVTVFSLQGDLFILSFINISERKKSEKELHENQLHLSSIIENPVGYMIYRLKAGPDPMSPIVTHVSPSITDMTGLELKDSKNYVKWFENVFPEDLPRLIAANQRGMTPPFIFYEEFRYIHPQKGLIWLSVRSNGIPYKDDPENIEWAHGILIDITAKKQAEEEALHAQEEIKKMNEELEKKVQERTLQLEKTNKELEAFSYSVSHDLRTPLRTINSFTRILLEDYSPLFDEEGKNVASTIIDSSLKMGQLIDDLLTFSRIGRAALNLQIVDMTCIVRSVFENTTESEDQEKILFQVDDLESAFADKNMMKVVWTNLISNAVKYTTHKENPIIEVSSTKADKIVTYHIKDNGAGFDMKYADKLFGVFQRLHADDEFQGTGVGLALIKRIITQHNGRVWAKGDLNKGAEFSFSLPLNKE